MASKSILRSAGLRSPSARTLMTPLSSKSILKRPTPLPLSPSPFAATFSVVISPSTNKLSPHVHFPASPAMVATFSALSPNTYDRAPMPVSPSAADQSPWAGRVVSPSLNSFKLSNPPKRFAAKADTLAVPSPFEDPRSPKPYKVQHSPVPNSAIIVTAPKVNKNSLAPPSPFQDPRSPKPYRPLSGVRFEELVLHVPRGNIAVEDLGKALTVYPRSPYPSAPIAGEEEDSDMSDLASPRGRTNARPPRIEKPTHTRARSLDVKPKRRTPAGLGSAINNPGEFLSPVKESPGVTSTTASKPAPLDFESESRLNNDFWQAVTLEAETPASAVGKGYNGFQSPKGNITFGNKDGTLWSPRPRQKERRGLAEMTSMLSPAQRNVFRKETVASPSPNDPFAAFPSFTMTLMNMGGPTYPPRARVDQ